MQTDMAPFPRDLSPRSCSNPDCKPGKRRHSKGCTLGLVGGPGLFNPATPWQNCCCDRCRMRHHYLSVTKPARDAKKQSKESSGENAPSP